MNDLGLSWCKKCSNKNVGLNFKSSCSEGIVKKYVSVEWFMLLDNLIKDYLV